MTGHRQQFALLDDVGGEEHGERDLAQFDGLERERAEANPQAGSVDVASDHRQERHEQQPDADEAEDVAVALQGRGSAHDRQGEHVGAEANRRPDGLQAGQLVIKAGHDDVTQPVEQSRKSQR